MSGAANAVAARFLTMEARAKPCQTNLEVCWRMACSAPNERDRRAWRDMAEKWKLLILMARSDEYEGYNLVVGDRGTSELELGDLIRHFCSNILDRPA